MNIDLRPLLGVFTPRKSMASAAIVLILAGGVAYQHVNKPPSAKAIATKARSAMAAELGRAPNRFVLVAGDSHAAALHLPCDSVNLAVNGLKARDVRVHLSELPTPVEPSAVLLVVGTNDVLRKQKPLSRIDDWVSEVQRTIGRFRNVVVTAIPPIGTELISVFDPDAVHVYSSHLEYLCSQGGCVYADPWKALRSKLFGEAKSGAMADGLHVADYAAPAGELAELLCPKPARQPEGIESVMAD